MKYPFNQKTLEAVLASDDEMFVELGQEAVEHFRNYTKTVIDFEKNVAEFKQDDIETYRAKTVQLDRKRRSEHELCIGSIDILNRLAGMLDTPEPPFCELNGLKASDVNRTDIGETVFSWAYVHIAEITAEAKTELGLDPSLTKETDVTDQAKAREQDPQHVIMEQYNALSKTNPYPMVEQDGNYRFVHYLRQEEVSVKEVKQRVFDELIKHKKLNKQSTDTLHQAVSLVAKSKQTENDQAFETERYDDLAI